MYGVIATTFFDSEENRRSDITISTLGNIQENKGRHVAIAIDNGSSDHSAWKWLIQNWKGPFLRLEKPMSISYGVNMCWYLYEPELSAGNAIAIKHDADVATSAPLYEVVDFIIDLFKAEPDIYLAGPRYQEGWAPRVLEDHSMWEHTDFAYGAFLARGVDAFRDIGYARQPYGRWGWGDHFDCWRVNHLGRKIATLKEYAFSHDTKTSSLPREYKDRNSKVAADALLVLQDNIRNGLRPIREDFAP